MKFEIMGLPQNKRIFLLGTRLLPPLTGITAKVFTSTPDFNLIENSPLLPLIQYFFMKAIPSLTHSNRSFGAQMTVWLELARYPS